MINFKTKYEKHANDNEKRRRSIKEKEKAKFNQSNIIKKALTRSSLLNNSSKKIIFDDENDSICSDDEGGNRTESKGSGKCVLFDGSESENETFEIKEQTQFTGKKGFELLNLQSTYGNDERFKIDERFFEDEADNDEKDDDDDDEEIKTENGDDADGSDEKAKQLKILENVLGTAVVRPEKEKKVKKRTYEMIRYDVSNKDHEMYEKNVPNKSRTLVTSKKKKENKTLRMEKEESPKPKVSKDKFYEVSNEIKNSFKEKRNIGTQFSLLQTYGLDGNEENQEIGKEEIEKEEEEEDSEEFIKSNFKSNEALQKKEEINRDKAKADENNVLAKGIWKEPFFFVADDSRFKEGLDFINKKDSPEAAEAADNYDKTRKILREILRLHLKKQMQKKDPFKNKIGGMNKKQLASLKSKKNSRALFSKGKTAKKSQGKTI